MSTWSPRRLGWTIAGAAALAIAMAAFLFHESRRAPAAADRSAPPPAAAEAPSSPPSLDERDSRLESPRPEPIEVAPGEPTKLVEPAKPAATEGDATGPYRWSVRILDGHTGLPVTGMKLAIEERLSTISAASLAQNPGMTRSRELETDEQGIAGIRERPGSGVTVTSADRFRWLSGRVEFDGSGKPDAAPHEIVSFEGGAIAGSVSDPFHGAPEAKHVVVDASDSSSQFTSESSDAPLPNVRSAESRRVVHIGKDGRFEVTGLPVGHELGFEIRGDFGPALARGRFRIERPREVVQLDPIVMPLRGMVRVVTDSQARAGPSVRASVWRERGESRYAIATQDGDLGSGILLDSVSDGDRLVVEPDGYRQHVVESVALTGEITTIVVPLDVGAVLEGTVTAADGSPIEGSRVDVVQVSRFGLEHHSAEADASGRFRVPGLSRCVASIHVDEGNPGARIWSGEHEMRDAVESIAVQFGARGTFRCRPLVDGAPYSKVVRAEVRRSDGSLVHPFPYSQARGETQVEIESIDPGPTSISIWSSDFSLFASISAVIEPSRVTDAGDVALAPARSASGVVLDARSGAPIRGACVRSARTTPASSFDLALAISSDPDHSPISPGIAMTNNVGRFALRGLAPDDRRLRVSHVDYRSSELELELATAGTTAELTPIRLEPQSADDRVVGRVVDPAGQPIAGAGLRLYSLDGCYVFDADCDAAGAFRIRFPLEGDVEVSARANVSRPDLDLLELKVAQRDRPTGEWILTLPLAGEGSNR